MEECAIIISHGNAIVYFRKLSKSKAWKEYKEIISCLRGGAEVTITNEEETIKFAENWKPKEETLYYIK